MPEGFWISPSNPNAEQGGGDLITPTHQTVDTRGPWVVFPNVDCAEAQGQVPLPHAALPLSAVKAILVEAAGVEADDTGGEGDIRDKLREPSPHTTDWDDIPAEDQAKLEAQFAPGTRVKTQYGTTTIPGNGLANIMAEAGVVHGLEEPEGSALAQIEAELPLETPDETGGYSPVEEHEPEETPVI